MDLKPLLNKIHLGDCLEFMRELPDKCVDLVLTDPPYGIDYGGQLKGKGDGKGGSDKYGWKSYNSPDWDKERPSYKVFKEIQRVSKNQIIWGGNYFADLLPPSQGWIFWDKGQREFSLADGELAWTSYDKALRAFDYPRAAALQDGKIHPTQKPLQLIKFSAQYAKLEKGIVLDCFSGSGTTALACHDLGLDFICIEKDPDYHAASVKRLEEHQKQGKLF